MSTLLRGAPIGQSRGLTGLRYCGNFNLRRTNFVTNGGFATNITGWTDGSMTTLTRSTEQAHSGAASGKAVVDTTDAGQWSLALCSVTVPAPGPYVLSMWLYIPAAWIPSVRIETFNGWAGISPPNGTPFNANMALRNQWQHVQAPLVIAAGGLSGQIRAVATGITAGQFVYIDDVQFEPGSFPTPYIETDGAAATRIATRHAA